MVHGNIRIYIRMTLFTQLFGNKSTSHFQRVGLKFAKRYNRPYIELFRFPRQSWYGTLHYDTVGPTELTLWNDTCIVREVHDSNRVTLGIKVFQVTDVEMPLDMNDISDTTMQLWLSKHDSHITFASGLGFASRV